ncbi:oxidoreductase [Pseudonocardia sp. KRD291]|uniref:oxidoreductase n=1 Tax=Pseudonocardia sp. KRD291 TaxID=2792007 RepID=UPI001C4A2341|nr:oxidoreductase [Pseudonocardia sp. KRD291]MBW0104832.1 oxidoreductase [Pseudonocardia sp. KRD291]
MGLLDRFRPGRTGKAARAVGSESEAHLREWAGARIGVEAFVEPSTLVTETTVVLVAHDGEWTRRRVGSPNRAKKLARSMKIPIYDVQLMGYPQRMRDHDSRERILRKRSREQDLRRRLADES